MNDREQITNLLNLYAVGVDATRWDLFDLIFTADAKTDYGPAMRWNDLASFKRDFAAFHDAFSATQHSLMNHQVHIDGDRANALHYGQWRLVRQPANGGGDFWEGSGWYDDVLVRTPAGWRIKDRVCCVNWWGGNPKVMETTPGAHFETITASLRAEAKAGRVRYIEAIKGK